MTQTVEEYFKSLPEFSDYGNGDIIEHILYDGKEVWSDSYIDRHRWYNRIETVMEVNGKYVKFWRYDITGDACMSDMDLEYDLGDFYFVEKKTRVIEEVYYD